MRRRLGPKEATHPEVVADPVVEDSSFQLAFLERPGDTKQSAQDAPTDGLFHQSWQEAVQPMS
jgi:hypothetical protein